MTTLYFLETHLYLLLLKLGFSMQNNENKKQYVYYENEVSSQKTDPLSRILTIIINSSKIIKYIIVIVFISLILLSGYSLFNIIENGSFSNKSKITTALIGNYIKKSQDLASLQYFYTNTGMYEDSKDVYGFDVPLTSKKFIISYSGKITLGVDLSDVKVDISDQKIIISNLGEVKILSHESDEKSMKIFDETTSLFAKFSITEYQTFFADEKSKLEIQILTNTDLLNQAKISAEETLKKILTLNPEIAAQYEIEFK